jgi:hypothetical protein
MAGLRCSTRFLGVTTVRLAPARKPVVDRHHAQCPAAGTIMAFRATLGAASAPPQKFPVTNPADLPTPLPA